MLTSHQILAYFALVHKGDWQSTFESVKNKVEIEEPKVLELLNSLSTETLSILDEGYPEYWKFSLSQPPFAIFYKGDISLLNNENYRRVSVVGSRKCTNYGVNSVTRIISGLPKNTIIVSGLASGIDADVTIIADPNIQNNTHEIHIKGTFGELVTITSNVSSPDNPKTSLLAAYSAAGLLNKLSETIQIGT